MVMDDSEIARWLKFNGVGAIGVAVQLAALALLTRIRIDYLVATSLAVECAVLHNFAWHERYTWRDRRVPGLRVMRLVSFHVTNGAVSMVGNLAIMWLLVGRARVPLLIANVVSIAVCSTVNYALSDRVVFRRTGGLG